MTKLSNLLFFTIIYSTMLIMILLIIITYMNLTSMVILMIIYSSLICLILSFWSKSPIYAIIMFLTLISGLLIIFLYFSSLISNMPNIYNFSLPTLMSFIISILSSLLLMIKFNFFSNNFQIFTLSYNSLMKLKSMDTMSQIYLNEKHFYNLLNIYFYPYSSMTFLAMFFLMLALFSIIKICSIKSATLRKII